MQPGNAIARVFEDKPAVRGPTPLMFGLIGPSGGGKTYSALRLATGIQRVFGGDIHFIDTESRRALHYANLFKFRHLEFRAPFAPQDYLAAIEHCTKKGAKTIIVDSMSHEHEGPGGILEWHSQEVERIMAAWKCSEEKANIPAWNKPKAARRRLINSLLQMDANFIFCFRAKDKIKMGGNKVTQLGFMPIAGEEFVFELTAKALLLPGANGIPTWKSDQVGEQMMIKLPEQFRGIFSGAEGKPLDEEIGEQLATWAAGDEIDINALVVGYEKSETAEEFDALEIKRKSAWTQVNGKEKARLKTASDAAKLRVTKTPDIPAAMEELREAGDAATLEEAWKQIHARFNAAPPLDLEAVFHECKERLAELEKL